MCVCGGGEVGGGVCRKREPENIVICYHLGPLGKIVQEFLL